MTLIATKVMIILTVIVDNDNILDKNKNSNVSNVHIVVMFIFFYSPSKKFYDSPNFSTVSSIVIISGYILSRQ